MRRWKIKLHFANGVTHLSTCALADIVTFIKKAKDKNNGVRPHSTLPIEAWLIDITFSKAVRACPGSELINATITQEFLK